TGLLRSLIKFDRPIHVSVIGHSHCRHAVLGYLFHEIRNTNSAVQKRIFRMKMEVNEGVSRHSTQDTRWSRAHQWQVARVRGEEVRGEEVRGERPRTPNAE